MEEPRRKRLLLLNTGIGVDRPTALTEQLLFGHGTPGKAAAKALPAVEASRSWSCCEYGSPRSGVYLIYMYMTWIDMVWVSDTLD